MNVHAFMHEGEIHSTETYTLIYTHTHTHTHTHLYNQMVVACFHVMLDLIENPRFEGWYNGDKTNKIKYFIVISSVASCRSVYVGYVATKWKGNSGNSVQ